MTSPNDRPAVDAGTALGFAIESHWPCTIHRGRCPPHHCVTTDTTFVHALGPAAPMAARRNQYLTPLTNPLTVCLVRVTDSSRLNALGNAAAAGGESQNAAARQTPKNRFHWQIRRFQN